MNYATSAGTAGYATSAAALSSSAGTATRPVYFSNGKPVMCETNSVVYDGAKNGGCLYALINNGIYPIPIASGSFYPITRIGIDKSMNNGKRVLAVQWYADGNMYTNKITCD